MYNISLKKLYFGNNMDLRTIHTQHCPYKNKITTHLLNIKGWMEEWKYITYFISSSSAVYLWYCYEGEKETCQNRTRICCQPRESAFADTVQRHLKMTCWQFTKLSANTIAKRHACTLPETEAKKTIILEILYYFLFINTKTVFIKYARQKYSNNYS